MNKNTGKLEQKKKQKYSSATSGSSHQDATPSTDGNRAFKTGRVLHPKHKVNTTQQGHSLSSTSVPFYESDETESKSDDDDAHSESRSSKTKPLTNGPSPKTLPRKRKQNKTNIENKPKKAKRATRQAQLSGPEEPALQQGQPSTRSYSLFRNGEGDSNEDLDIETEQDHDATNASQRQGFVAPTTIKRVSDAGSVVSPDAESAMQQQEPPSVRTALQSLYILQKYCKNEGIGEELRDLDSRIRNHWFEKAMSSRSPTLFE
jgi:hypothetical protein